MALKVMEGDIAEEYVLGYPRFGIYILHELHLQMFLQLFET